MSDQLSAASQPVVTGPPDLARVHQPLAVVNTEPTSQVYRLVARVVHAWVGLLARRRWFGMDRVPTTGPVIVAGNHVSYFDPEVLIDSLIWAGRWPSFLAKAQLWKIPGLGWLARTTGQIPVNRGSAQAGDALINAEQALAQGRLVVIYPEGTLTHDPLGWPMTAKPGAARLALRTGAPVLPIAQWGAQQVMPGPGVSFPRFWKRHPVSVFCGEPVDLSDLTQWLGTERESEAEKVATERILAALTQLQAVLRREPVPVDRWDSRVSARVTPAPTDMS